MNKFLVFTGLGLVLLFGCSRCNEAGSERKGTAYEAGSERKRMAYLEFATRNEPTSFQESNGIDLYSDMTGSDTTMANRMTSSAARIDLNDTLHRFIRAADLRFRVKNVLRASMAIEDLVRAQGGFITNTDLRTEQEDTERIPISPDRLLEVSRYSVQNHMTVRVPAARLDTTLRTLGQWVDLFDHRTVTAKDVRLDLMRNTLAARREQAHGDHVQEAIDTKGRKLKETTTAGESVLKSAENADNAHLANLELQDRIDYSTVELDIYQRSLIKRTVIANEHSVEAYRPSLLSRTGAALAEGWRLLCSLVIGLLSVWPMVLIVAGAAWFLLRRRKSNAGK